ncbi:hypothetical protein AgCh_023419 [Apium graveolens]
MKGSLVQRSAPTTSSDNPAVNWLYWPPIGTSKFPQPPMKAQSPQLEGHLGCSTLPLVQAQSNRPLAQSDRRGKQQKKQGSKGENNLKFLLQKVLKQSDVSNLGRIVLPKKEAETQLPQLEERDGIPIVIEDIATSKVWNLRYRYNTHTWTAILIAFPIRFFTNCTNYISVVFESLSLRFWPNNKSRMYVLENTGEFVKENGLQEGDFIVLYSDIRYNKYVQTLIYCHNRLNMAIVLHLLVLLEFFLQVLKSLIYTAYKRSEGKGTCEREI